MSRSRRRLLAAPLALAAVLALGACGQKGIQLSEDDPSYQAARLFEARCSGCHTLEVAGTEGSTTNIATRENKDGPNFNQRQESVEDVLYAIQNGGFSSGPMPQNIVTGEEAEAVAKFVAEYAGREAERPPDPTGDAPTGSQ